METKTRPARPSRLSAEAALPRSRIGAALFRGMHACRRNNPRASRELAPLMLLVLLDVKRQSLSFGYLAEQLDLERYEMTRLCDRMQAEGLVARGNDPQDLRLRRVTLLEAGRQVVTTLMTPVCAELS